MVLGDSSGAGAGRDELNDFLVNSGNRHLADSPPSVWHPSAHSWRSAGKFFVASGRGIPRPPAAPPSRNDSCAFRVKWSTPSVNSVTLETLRDPLTPLPRACRR